MKWDTTFVNGNVLKHDIDSIIFRGKKYNIKIEVGKYKTIVDDAFEELNKLDNHNDNQDITPSIKDGKLHWNNAKWVRGSHTALHYRGNELKRKKAWFQENDKGYYAYKYTGWQKSVLQATFVINRKQFPKTSSCIEVMKKDCMQNHWIATKYKDGNDYIGMHSDKMRTWTKNSSFQVIKWGHPRIFEIALKDNENRKKCTIIFSKILPAGTSIIVDSETNELTRHGVPIMENINIGVSGSIVGRHIETFHTIEETQKMVVKARLDKIKRQLKKISSNN